MSLDITKLNGRYEDKTGTPHQVSILGSKRPEADPDKHNKKAASD
jgi:hypothetical protein